MEACYSGVIARTLTARERRVPTSETDLPLVLEAQESSSLEFLCEFLQHHSSKIANDLAAHGAVLLRGFDVSSPADFERSILSIRGMKGMSEVLFSEPGRTVVDGTRFVFHTNTLVKTGGSLLFGMFHTENYVVPDVPRYISFCCEMPSRLGGETGLLNVVKLYADLPEDLHKKLEHSKCLVSLYPISEMARRYELSPEILHEFLTAYELPTLSINGSEYVSIYKPSVVRHPVTGERSLLVNFGYVPSVQRSMIEAFIDDYSGFPWLLHRLVWKVPAISRFIARASYERHVHQRGAVYLTEPDGPVPDALPLTSLFTKEQIRSLGKLMRHRYSSFLWRRSDILILDNLKVAHNGMAGHGERALTVMMCNPLMLPPAQSTSGLYDVPHAEPNASLGDQLARIREINRSKAH